MLKELDLIIVVDSIEIDEWGPEDNVGYGAPPTADEAESKITPTNQ